MSPVAIASIIAAAYIVYQTIDKFIAADDAGERLEEAKDKRFDEMDKLVERKPNDAENTDTAYRDAVRDAAKKSADFGLSAKELELELGLVLPDIIPQRCP